MTEACSAKWYKAEEMPSAPNGKYWVYEDKGYSPGVWCLCTPEGYRGLHSDCQHTAIYEVDLTDGAYSGLRFYGPITPPEYPKD